MKNLYFYFIITTSLLFAQQPWQKANGPFGGNIEGFAAKSNGDFYAVNNTVLYKSTNNGLSWFQLTDEVSNINAVEISPSGRIYLGTDYRGVWWSDNDGASWNNNQISTNTHTGLGVSIYNINLNSAGHIFVSHWRSVNGGASWFELSIYSNDYLFLSANEILAATTTLGIQKSTNNGSSWFPLNNGMGNITVNCIEASSGLLIAGTASNGIYISTDNGQNWTQSNSGLTNLNILELEADNINRIFASTQDGIFISVDNAASWQELTIGVQPYWFYDFDIVNGDELFASTQKYGLLYSSNNGSSWGTTNSGMTVLGINNLVSNNEAEIFLNANGSIYYSSNNGDEWELRDNELSQTGIISLGINTTGTLYAGTINSGLFESPDKGNNWTNIAIPGVNRIDKIAVDISNRITISSQDKLYHSSDSGMNWSQIFNSDTSFFLPQYLSVNDNGTIFYAGLTFFLDDIIFYSNDHGVSWDSVSFGNLNSSITSLYSDGKNIYAGFSNSSIRYSPDNGETWLDFSQVPSGSVNAMVKTGNGIFLAAASGGIFYTDNNGISWNPLLTGLPSFSSPNFIEADVNNMIYTGFYSQGFYRNDSWHKIIPVELSSLTVSLIDNDVTLRWTTSSENNNYGFEIERSPSLIPSLREGTSGSSPLRGELKGGWLVLGFVEGKGTTTEQQLYSFIDKDLPSGKYKYRLKQIDHNGSYTYSESVEIEVEIPGEFSLYQNYPNPFNPRTTINYSIAESGLVTIKVFDVLGNEVSLLVNELKEPGYYKIEFNAAKLASGTYFYRMESRNFVETKKLIVLK